MNNKGFTLVELIAVLAVMITILLIAIPSISSSIERNKGNLSEKNEEIIYDAAEIYSDLYLKNYFKHKFSNGECGIHINELINAELVGEETTIIEKNNSIEEKKEECVWQESGEYKIKSCFVGDNDGRCGVE